MNQKTNFLGERIKVARKKADLSQKDLASRLDIAYQTLNKYEKGHRTPDAELLRRMVKILKTDPGFLLTGEGYEDAGGGKGILREPGESYGERYDYIHIPLYDVEASAGHGAIIDKEEIVDVLAFKREWIKKELRANPDDLCFLFVDGESMEPTLRPGELILINRADVTAIRDGIYVLRLDGTLLIKRLQRLPGNTIRVTSDNQVYESFTIGLKQTDEDFSIIGRVIWAGRRF